MIACLIMVNNCHSDWSVSTKRNNVWRQSGSYGVMLSTDEAYHPFVSPNEMGKVGDLSWPAG